jgi:hypothetical protein
MELAGGSKEGGKGFQQAKYGIRGVRQVDSRADERCRAGIPRAGQPIQLPGALDAGVLDPLAQARLPAFFIVSVCSLQLGLRMVE